MKYLIMVVSLLICSKAFSRAANELPDNSPSPVSGEGDTFKEFTPYLGTGDELPDHSPSPISGKGYTSEDFASYLKYRKLHKKSFITSKEMAVDLRLYSKFNRQLKEEMKENTFL